MFQKFANGRIQSNYELTMFPSYQLTLSVSLFSFSAGSVYVDFIFTVDVDLGAAKLRLDFNDYLVNDQYGGYTFDKSITKFEYPGNPEKAFDMIHHGPDSKVRGANMGSIWGRQDPGWPHVGPMIFAISGGHPLFNYICNMMTYAENTNALISYAIPKSTVSKLS